MSVPFLILALPRSRTTWLSKFLTYGLWVCGHEELQYTRSLKDIKTWFTQPYIGTVETAATPWWRLINALVPNVKILVIRRPVDEVVHSLMKLAPYDQEQLTKSMTYLDRKLGQLTKRLPNVMSVNYEDLNDQETCASIFEYCLDLPFDVDHYNFWKDKNVQINFMQLTRYAHAYKDQLERLGYLATQKIKAQLTLKRHKLIPPAGISIKQEPFNLFLQDGVKLFEQHCVEVGEDPNQWTKKNIPLMRYLSDEGLLQVTVARSNGRMFGYLMTLITPSLVDSSITSATHSTFYADPSFPGLGLKLQRAANENLRLGGVDEVFMQTGTRGDGDRLDVIFNRLGAESVGQLYRLDLKGT